jgi:hypothetical protein
LLLSPCTTSPNAPVICCIRVSALPAAMALAIASRASWVASATWPMPMSWTSRRLATSEVWSRKPATLAWAVFMAVRTSAFLA